MAQCTVHTSTLRGVEGLPVEVQVDVGAGIPSFSIVGLPDAAVQEARERVRSAIRAAGYEFPNARVVVNLAPGPLRKHGTGFDLPIALALLGATNQIAATLFDDATAVGELSLAGEVRPVPGMLAHALAARDSDRALLAAPGAPGGGDLPGLKRLALSHIARLRSGRPEVDVSVHAAGVATSTADFADIVGHQAAKRALEIAAAGGHNVLMVGPPGSGKTMLARRLASILPPLTADERLESALVHSVGGLDESCALAGERPFRAPHHSASIAGLVGGGSPPRPGEASLAHNGVLFLDEMPEFGPAALQALRQPVEDGYLTLVRADGRVRFPARFALVGAANPCPCGFHGDPQRRCTCPESAIARYESRIGGPLIDRIDIRLQVDRVDPGLLLDATPAESSSAIANRVLVAVEAAQHRGVPTASLSGEMLLSACRMSRTDLAYVESTARMHHLSGRGITRLLRVARTIADLAGAQRVGADHLDEAIGLRCASHIEQAVVPSLARS